jgi:hypothetical protein
MAAGDSFLTGAPTGPAGAYRKIGTRTPISPRMKMLFDLCEHARTHWTLA